MLMWVGWAYTLRGGQGHGKDQQQDKGQGLAKSQLPRDKERNKPRQSLGDVALCRFTHHIHMNEEPQK